MNKARLALRKYHIWLGWLVGLPLLAWTVSGLVMVIQPIEKVRGEDLIAKPPALAPLGAPVPPAIGPRPVASLKLEQRPGGPRWIVTYADGGSRLADAATGRLLPPLGAGDARAIVEARYTGKERISAIDRISADDPPLELRRNVESWRVTMADGTRFYVDAATGDILARRTPFWRIYDFMWGLHIMDLKTREDTSNPLVIGLGAVTLVTTILAIVLLPMTIRRKKARGGSQR